MDLFFIFFALKKIQNLFRIGQLYLNDHLATTGCPLIVTNVDLGEQNQLSLPTGSR